MKKPVLFTMKMKDEKERELWQKHAKNRYGEPLSVVIRRLIEEDMKEAVPREHEKLEKLLNSLREENNEYYRKLLNRITIITEHLSSSTYELSFELDILKGLVLQKLDEFHQNEDYTPDSFSHLKEEISEILKK